MLAVRLPAGDIEALIAPPLAIAAVNSPALCVVAGPHGAIDELAERLGHRGVMARRLHTSHAFHSPMMDPIVEPLAEYLRGVTLSPPRLPYVSAVTGDWADDAQVDLGGLLGSPGPRAGAICGCHGKPSRRALARPA